MQFAPLRNEVPAVFVIADDLTGACDSAAAFLGSSHSVRVVLKATMASTGELRNGSQGPGTVLAFSTGTRNATRSQAVEAVDRTMGIVGEFGTSRILFKKIDSAGRGQIAAETMAALRASSARLALFAPAFPDAGRTVQQGVLKVRDSAQQQTSTPLVTLFSDVDAEHIEFLHVGTEDNLEHGIERALGRGTRVLLCDSERQDDLTRLARVAYRIGQPVLWTGSAGLAHALASLFPASRKYSPADLAWPEGRTLLFVGTNHPITMLQLSQFQQQLSAFDTHVQRIDWSSESVAEIRSEFTRSSVAALILTGGDTAAFVLTALNASSIRLAGQLAPGIPWGFIEGGDADGCVIVTKSGGFGPPEALVHAFNFCSRRVCEPA
jgi:uncharacterized protein YgbK (DUF1537 family)